MLKADLHLHTLYSHGKNTPLEMFEAAKHKSVSFIGFSEHSPRPDGYNYHHEYREQLNSHLNDYINQVMALKSYDSAYKTLLGMEIDWISGEEDFTRRSCSRFDFDYLIGSVHFLDHWGFDDGADQWVNADQEECERRYISYFRHWKEMLDSGLFQIAAHPDLIKIFSVEKFHIWLNNQESKDVIRDCLLTLKNMGMAMEISSAGLRKACHEIYPCAPIMEMAATLSLPVTLASDAHCVEDIAYGFEELAKYALSFGFTEQSVFEHGKRTVMPIIVA